jgi:hypothetical protein
MSSKIRIWQRKLFFAVAILFFLPLASFSSIETHVILKIADRDGKQETLQLTNNSIDASILGAIWGGLQTLSDAVSAAVNFFGGDVLGGGISAAAAYVDVRNLINQVGDKTAAVLATTRAIDIDQTDYLELTFFAYGGDDGIGRCDAAVPRMSAFSIGSVTRSGDYKHAQRVVRIQCRGTSNLAALTSGPYVVDFFAKEGSDAVGGPGGCHTCLAAHHLITLVLSSSVQTALSGLPANVQQNYRNYIGQLQTATANLRQTYIDYDATAATMLVCNALGTQQAIANCQAPIVSRLVRILVRRATLQSTVDDLVDKILAIFFGGGANRHTYKRPPLATNIKILR